jgi:CDP-diacylglycerol---glycerol-3-phosphate 3-phosphatidyltransferase
MFDMVDGALARVRNQKTVFGAFFDSTLDRYSEGLVLLGIILFASTSTSATYRTWTIALAYTAGLGSLMVSYARARAEGLGLELKSGLMARPERVLLLAAGLLIGGEAWLPWTLLILAVTSVFTSVQRIVAVWLKLRGTDAARPTTGMPGDQDGNAPGGAKNGNNHRIGSSAPSISSERSTQH